MRVQSRKLVAQGAFRARISPARHRNHRPAVGSSGTTPCRVPVDGVGRQGVDACGRKRVTHHDPYQSFGVATAQFVKSPQMLLGRSGDEIRRRFSSPFLPSTVAEPLLFTVLMKDSHQHEIFVNISTPKREKSTQMWLGEDLGTTLLPCAKGLKEALRCFNPL